MLLEGKYLLITGASRGIGRSIAETATAHGAAVALTGRSEEVELLAAQLVEKGHQAIAIRGDLCDEEHVRTVMKTCRKEFGRLDILVNNAGILEQARLGMINMPDVRKMLDINFIALINVSQYAVRLMAKSALPSIINIASIAGTQGIDGISAYSASKAAVVGFTKSAAKELAAQNIRVNAIAPGFIDTQMTRTLPEEWFQARVESVRLGQQIGSPQDIANCALFLASDLASYITGQVIGVDGGMIV